MDSQYVIDTHYNQGFSQQNRFIPTGHHCEDCKEWCADEPQHYCKPLKNETLRHDIDVLKALHRLENEKLYQQLKETKAQLAELLTLVKEMLYHPDMPIAQDLANKYPQLGSLHDYENKLRIFLGDAPGLMDEDLRQRLSNDNMRVNGDVWTFQYNANGRCIALSRTVDNKETTYERRNDSSPENGASAGIFFYCNIDHTTRERIRVYVGFEVSGDIRRDTELNDWELVDTWIADAI